MSPLHLNKLQHRWIVLEMKKIYMPWSYRGGIVVTSPLSNAEDLALLWCSLTAWQQICGPNWLLFIFVWSNKVDAVSFVAVSLLIVVGGSHVNTGSAKLTPHASVSLLWSVAIATATQHAATEVNCFRNAKNLQWSCRGLSECIGLSALQVLIDGLSRYHCTSWFFPFTNNNNSWISNLWLLPLWALLSL